MAYVLADPKIMAAAVSDLATIGSDLSAAHLVAAARTTSVIPAAADEVSAAIANVMSTHARSFQAMAQSASTFHQQFTRNINAAAAAYSSAESGIAAMLTPTFPSLPQFFQAIQSDFGTAIGNFNGSFGSFPNLAWGQLERAGDDALALLLFPITYPIYAVSVFLLEAVIDDILNSLFGML
jgi:PE family